VQRLRSGSLMVRTGRNARSTTFTGPFRSVLGWPPNPGPFLTQKSAVRSNLHLKWFRLVNDNGENKSQVVRLGHYGNVRRPWDGSWLWGCVPPGELVFRDNRNENHTWQNRMHRRRNALLSRGQHYRTQLLLT